MKKAYCPSIAGLPAFHAEDHPGRRPDAVRQEATGAVAVTPIRLTLLLTLMFVVSMMS